MGTTNHIIFGGQGKDITIAAGSGNYKCTADPGDFTKC